MDSYPGDFPFGIMDVVELLHLRIRRRQANSVYVDCPFCGDRRGKMNVNFVKNVWRCNYCEETQSKRRLSLPKVAYSAFLCVMMSMMFCQPAYAATDVWTKAKEIMQDVYTQILAISTIAAIVTASVALLLMNFSRSGRTVDESRAWLKRICITWAILNGLGFIMAYVTPLFSGGQWTG